jgi:hypothetical protein
MKKFFIILFILAAGPLDITGTLQSLAQAQTRTISGDVGTNTATLTWNDGGIKTTTSSSNGNYSITVPNNWSGTVTPSKTGFTFSPVNRTYTNVTSNQDHQDYNATAITYIISGNTGTGTVTLSYNDNGTKTATSNSSGVYSFTVSYNWTGAVTPSKTGYIFLPGSTSYANVLSDQTGQNYTAVRVVTISGDVNSGAVTLSYTDTTAKTVVSAGNGNYTITVPYGWSGTVTPSKTGFDFSPVNRAYTNVTSNRTSQDYSPTAITFTISGNTGTNGVTLTYNDGGIQTTSSNGAGNYSFTVSYNWSGIVVPSKTGWAFNPQYLPYTSVLENKIAQNYTASRTYLISGKGGRPGVVLSWTDTTAKSVTGTGSNGNYSIIVSNGWSGTVTPALTGYTFTPGRRTYSNVTADQTGQDYDDAVGRTIAGNAGAAGTILAWFDGFDKTAVADAAGAFIITVVNHWTGTVTPTLSGYTFSPTSRSFTNRTTDTTGQNFTATPFVTANLKVFLSGPFSGGSMTTALNSLGLIPLSSERAYAAASYGYDAKSVVSIPNSSIVDWVLVELRTGTTGATKVAIQSAFVKSDGTIVDTDGSSVLRFNGIAHGLYYIVVRHRNHQPVMSAVSLLLSGTSAPYDFTTGQSKAYGTNALYFLDTGIFGLVKGDVNRNGSVKFTGAGSDRGMILDIVGFIDPSIPVNGYYDADVNMDGIVKFAGVHSDRGSILDVVGFVDPSISVPSQVPN